MSIDNETISRLRDISSSLRSLQNEADALIKTLPDYHRNRATAYRVTSFGGSHHSGITFLSFIEEIEDDQDE